MRDIGDSFIQGEPEILWQIALADLHPLPDSWAQTSLLWSLAATVGSGGKKKFPGDVLLPKQPRSPQTPEQMAAAFKMACISRGIKIIEVPK